MSLIATTVPTLRHFPDWDECTAAPPGKLTLLTFASSGTVVKTALTAEP